MSTATAELKPGTEPAPGTPEYEAAMIARAEALWRIPANSRMTFTPR